MYEQLIAELRTKCDTCHQCVQCLELDAKAAEAIERMQKCIDVYRLAAVRCHDAVQDSTRALRERAEAALRGE